MKRYIWIFNIQHIVVTIVVVLAIGYFFTYLISCSLYSCGAKRAFKELGPYIVLVIGGIAIYGHITSLTRPVAGITGAVIVDPGLAKYGEGAVKTGHNDFLSLINTIIGVILAFLIAWAFSWFIL